MLLYGITGACIVGIPLTFLLLFQCWRNAGLKQQINSYKELEKENLYMTVWVLKEDIACDIRQMADIKRIAGRKTKTALKKGTIMQADLLYDK